MDNSRFWQSLDELICESKIIIDRPKGSAHPKYNFIYMVDYGYLGDTTSPDGGGIDVWMGSKKDKKCDALICTIDLVKRDSEIKLLIGCSEREKDLIMKFHNESSYMKGLMFRRAGDE